jgi:hypothetical protein
MGTVIEHPAGAAPPAPFRPAIPSFTQQAPRQFPGHLCAAHAFGADKQICMGQAAFLAGLS